MYEVKCDEIRYGFRRRTRPAPHVLIGGPHTAHWTMVDHAALQFRIGTDWYKVSGEDFEYFYATWINPQEN